MLISLYKLLGELEALLMQMSFLMNVARKLALPPFRTILVDLPWLLEALEIYVYIFVTYTYTLYQYIERYIYRERERKRQRERENTHLKYNCISTTLLV